jgi:hypothetical protein
MTQGAERRAEWRDWAQSWNAELDYLVRLYLSLDLGGLAFSANLAFGSELGESSFVWWVVMAAVLIFAGGVVGSLLCCDARLDLY